MYSKTQIIRNIDIANLQLRQILINVLVKFLNEPLENCHLKKNLVNIMNLRLYQSNFQNPHWQNVNNFIIYITNICHFKFHRRYMKKMHA